jgi:L-iditol 2-dehydrogenase
MTRAVLLRGPGLLEITDVEGATMGAHDVTLDVAAVGLCGTDFHIYAGEGNYNLDAQGRPIALERHPQILGHEITGIVRELGSEVRGLEPGQRVVVDQGLNCHSVQRTELCEYCASGDSHQCEFFAEHGITGLPGGLAETLVVPAINVIAVHSDLPHVVVAMTEPLGCVLHACAFVERSNARYRLRAAAGEPPVRSILICGAGPAGLLFVQVLRHVYGFEGTLLVSDPVERKRALARGFGAETIDPGADDLVERVRAATDARMVECLIDASGSGPLFTQIPGLIRKQATVVLYGHGHRGASLEVLNQVQWREPNLVSPIGASGALDENGVPVTYRRALDLLEDGTIEVADLVTHRYEGLASVPGAFDGDHHAPDYVKGVVLL